MPKTAAISPLLSTLLRPALKTPSFHKFNPVFKVLNDQTLQAHTAGNWVLLERLNQQAFALDLKDPLALADTWFFRGVIERKNKAYPAAERAFKLALTLHPKHPNAGNSLGLLYNDMDRLDEAEACYRQVLVTYPTDTNATGNLAILYFLRYQHAQAVQLLLGILKREPRNKVIHHSLSLIMLAMGNFKDGWQAYEWRMLVHPHRYGLTTAPYWQGEPLGEKVLLIHAEQGFGDSIQFVRYIPLIQRKNPQAKIIFIAPLVLHRLLQNIEGIAQLISSEKGTSIPAHHVQCALLSAPKCMGTTLATIPNRLPYLQVTKTQTLAQRTHNVLRVGICWAGRDEHNNDRHRSISFETIEPLLRHPAWEGKIQWVILQRDRRPPELAQQAKQYGWLDPFSALTNVKTDFYDSAQLLHQLDLTITIDSALAHLAGALECPVWVLLPHINPDWRWLTARADSPWYPGCMRLLRQPRAHDWPATIQRAANDLAHLIEAKSTH